MGKFILSSKKDKGCEKWEERRLEEKIKGEKQKEKAGRVAFQHIQNSIKDI